MSKQTYFVEIESDKCIDIDKYCRCTNCLTLQFNGANLIVNPSRIDELLLGIETRIRRASEGMECGDPSYQHLVDAITIIAKAMGRIE